ncbi:conserved Plasmodium protein, unknown function [Plasmodium knowlesi strain H]|uniref:Uncharacterized protein n=3 Tax=Plasmodium knowlesi TaxID=5850 RepID=A0A5K1U376_PLAKH|nr:conserved protein, unknown function [Plasmodium knowlesi strain H]OTN66175.1 Uncharacterized protein PKNOH_S09524700 [Plasmodium knowlesi]CAA9986412.1 conserved protein, unknown function [Plasmodium knowlesi strain H]SBO27184.1 conserved Plasmodium protein, unknown function [Plasmodium knowlesi strain H]SBO29547.1 conserved Plasmodium protein, unknown function [Plasmodium knowlesi strain H]VVS75886.1 conserved protein, unknown function [Plasmodium knowlesi strain H]|eukprot:XP_002257818.1 hypothetical protein, conserved in Plasmodium species [Plasmodium knowlesi strain H]
MVPARHSAHDAKAVFNSKEEDLFYLLKNRSTTEDHRKRVKIKSLDVLIQGFLRDERGIFEKYRSCELDSQNGEDYTEDCPTGEPSKDNPEDERNKKVGTQKERKPPPIHYNDEYNDLLFLSRKDMDSERVHLKKIQNATTEVCNSLKFYKAENHDTYKFRPTNIDTDIIKIKHDLEILQYSDYTNCPGNDIEKKALRMVQEKCKKIVQGLNFNYDSVDVSEVIDILNVITTPDFDERIDKCKYLKLFLNKYHYVYPYEDIPRLRKIRKYMRRKHLTRGDFYIDHNDISKFYLKTNLEKIIKNEEFINNMLNLHIDNGKFWVQIVHNIWIPLAMEIFNTTRNSFYSYLMNYESDASVLDQYVYSRENGKFYKFSHYIFTGALFSGVPSIYRLLMRLHAYKYSELRINMMLEKNSHNIYDDMVISSLNYHIDVIRNLFPFFKEYINIDMEKIVESFFDSAFFDLIMNSLRKENIEKVTVSQKYLTFINSFFLMITEFLYGVSNKNCLERINENQIKLLDILKEIFYDDMNILIGRDVLLFVADLLCLYKLRSIYIKKKYCDHILQMTEIIKNAYYHKSSLTNENTWKQVYVIAVKIHHFVSCALQRQQTVKDNIMLQELTIVNRYYLNNLKQENSIGEFYFLKNINYGIYCWNSVCNKYLNVHHFEHNKNNFDYCPGCYIATYCSEKCRLTHLLSSHHNVCVYFKTVPSFLKYNDLEDDPSFQQMKYLNIFQHIATFDRGNDTYQIIY